MSSYEFKEWLNYSEAAAYLSDKTGRKFDADAINRAATNNIVRAHYWPTDDADLGVFSIVFDEERMKKLPPFFERYIESPVPVLLEQAEYLVHFEGPVPITHYQIFAKNCKAGHKQPIGITIQINPLDSGTIIAGGCYRVDDNGKAVSLKEGLYDFFIHLSDLEQLAATLPDKPQLPPCLCNLNLLKAPDQDVSEGTPFIHSPVPWMAYPDSRGPEASNVRPDRSAAPKRPEPLLRTIGFAAHLIAELGDKLDQLENAGNRKRGLSCGGRPNCSTIAKELARVAADHNYDLKDDGFSKTLSAALKHLQP